MERNFVFGRVLLFLFVIHAKSDTTKHHRNELSEKHLKKKNFFEKYDCCFNNALVAAMVQNDCSCLVSFLVTLVA